MTRTKAGWHVYHGVDQLIAGLDLTGEAMARARETADEHVAAPTQALAE